jgi:acetylornithine deacetylase
MILRTNGFATAIPDLILEERCQQILVELVRVPSPQTDLLEAEPQLGVFIRTAVEPRLRAMGIKDIRYDTMGNLIAEFGESSTGQSLMLISNAMNQPRSTMKNAYAGDVVNGSKYGLPGMVVLGKGASEQKSSMAAMLAALEAVNKSGIRISGRVVFLCCVSGESGQHDAIRNIVEVENVRTDVAVLGGTSLQISIGNRGRLDIDVTVTGSPAHSSKPQEGCDAVAGAIEFIGRLREGVDLSREHPDLGQATLAVTHLRSFPDSTHTIQDRVNITIDRRLLPGDDPQGAFDEVCRIAEQTNGAPDPSSGKVWSVELHKGAFMYPSLSNREGLAVKLISAAFQDTLGRSPKLTFAPNAFDQGYLNHMGIDTVNFGAGESRYAHTDLDMASVTRVREAARVYARAIIGHVGA